MLITYSHGTVIDCVAYLDLCLYLLGLPAGQHLDMTGHLLTGAALACPQLDVPRDQLITTYTGIHRKFLKYDRMRF